MECARRERERMSEIEGERDREKGSGDVEEGGVPWLQGIMGAGLASSLAGNRILNGCLLAPSHRHTRTNTHAHTHTHLHPTPTMPSLPAPTLTPHTHSITLNFIRPAPVCVCVYAPRGHMVDHLDDFGGLELWSSSTLSLLLLWWLQPS